MRSLSIIHIRGRTSGELGLQDMPNGSSVRYTFESSFTKEETGSVKAIFEGGFKFAVSEARNKFDITASTYQGEIGEKLGSNILINSWQFMINNR